MKKIIVSIIVIGMLLTTSMVTVNVVSGKACRIIYVDDDNTQGPWDGTYEHPYQFIQEGIDNADDGDTVYVFSGTYIENVVVDKGLKLIGENNQSTIVDGNELEHVVIVISSNVTIKEFTIINSGNTCWHAAIKLNGYYQDFENIDISELIIKNNQHGITVHFVSNVNIKNCVFTNNKKRAIRISGDSNNIAVENCNISNGGQHGDMFCSPGGILVHGEFGLSSNVSIKHCVLRSNAGVGIYLTGKENFEVAYNEIYSSSQDGILFEIEKNLNIYNNKICKNNCYGIFAFGNFVSNTGNIIIKDNYIAQNNHSGIRVQGYRNCITIKDNTIESNKKYGIFLRNSSYNNILNNNFFSSNISASFMNSNGHNNWNNNYWDRPRVLPKAIFGKMETKLGWIPWVEFDWHPAQEPYDIPGGGESTYVQYQTLQSSQQSTTVTSTPSSSPTNN